MADSPFAAGQQKAVAVLYNAFDAHTGVIAERVASDLDALGFPVALHNFREIPETFDLGGCAAAVILAPTRLGEHATYMVNYLKAHRAQFEGMPAAFVSGALSEAGADIARDTPQQHARYAADMQAVLGRLSQETGWRPAYVQPVADQAETPFNFVARFLVRLVVKKAGAGAGTASNYEFTDWDHLDDFVNVFAKAVRAAARKTAERPPATGSRTDS